MYDKIDTKLDNLLDEYEQVEKSGNKSEIIRLESEIRSIRDFYATEMF